MGFDPIVNEVREAGAKLAAEAGYDVHRFFENLRQAQKKYGKALVRKPPEGSWGGNAAAARSELKGKPGRQAKRKAE